MILKTKVKHGDIFIATDVVTVVDENVHTILYHNLR